MSSRSPTILALKAVALAASAVWLIGVTRPAAPPYLSDTHLWRSLTTAANLHFCGSPRVVNELGGDVAIGQALFDEPETRQQPFADWISGRYGSVAAYCARLGTPSLNNENSLMLLVRAGLFVRPQASLVWIGNWLYWIKVAWLTGFSLVCLMIGGSIVTALAALAVGLLLLEALSLTTYYSVYTLLLPAILAQLGLWGLLLLWRPSKAWQQAAAVLLLGASAGFAANLRTSYAPLLWMLAALYAVFARRIGASGDPSNESPRGSAVAFTARDLGAFAAGYMLFWAVCIAPLVPAGNAWSDSQHVIAHPLILSLALPPNELARREGIEWSDSLGLTLARRLDPGVGYLDARYSAAMTKYYVTLWREHPAEMAGIYETKASIAGADVFRKVRGIPPGGRYIDLTVLPFHWITDGRWLLALWLALAAIALGASYVRRSAECLAIGAISCVLLLLQIESSVIVPNFFLNLHSVYLGLASLLGASVTVWVVSRAVGFELAGASLPWRAAMVVGGVLMARLVLLTLQPDAGALIAADGVAVALLAAVAFIAVRSVAGIRWAHASVALLVSASMLQVGAAFALHRDRLKGPPLYGDQPPQSAITGPSLLGDPQRWPFRATGVTFNADRTMSVDGPIDTPYSYLVVSEPIAMKGGQFVVAEGNLGDDGGFTLGLHLNGRWASQVNVTQSGPFKASVPVPGDGAYQVVIANALSAGQTTNAIHVTAIGLAQ